MKKQMKIYSDNRIEKGKQGGEEGRGGKKGGFFLKFKGRVGL